MKNMEATTVAHILVHEFICRFGIPEHLHTDQGRNFEAEIIIKEICKLLDIKKIWTSPYHPQSDRMIERFNRTLLNMLSTALEKNCNDWDLRLPMLMLAYRTSVQETTGVTPFSLMFGRSAWLPIDIEFDLPYASYDNPKQYQKQLRQRLQQAYASVERNRQKCLYDRSVHGPQYDIGDEVWLHCPAVPKGHCKKFRRPWQGSFIVVKVIDNCIPTNLSRTKSGTKSLKKRDFWSKIRTFFKNPMKWSTVVQNPRRVALAMAACCKFES